MREDNRGPLIAGACYMRGQIPRPKRNIKGRGRLRKGKEGTENGGHEDGVALGPIHGGAALEGGQLRRWRGRPNWRSWSRRAIGWYDQKKGGSEKRKPTASREYREGSERGRG